MSGSFFITLTHLRRWEYPAMLVLVIGMTLVLMLRMERMAERASGYRVQWGARLFIPLPALLLLLINFQVHFVPIGLGQGAELNVMFNIATFITFCLPWVVSSGDGRKTPLRLVLGVWVGYVVYAIAMFYLWVWAYSRLKN